VKRLPYYFIILTMALVLVACVRPLQDEEVPTDGAAPETSAPLEALPGTGGENEGGTDGQTTFTFGEEGGEGENAGTEGADGSGGEGEAMSSDGAAGTDGAAGEGTTDDGSGGENAGTTDPNQADDTQTNTSGDTIHTIVAGDVLGRIAEQYGVTVEDIMIVNGLDNPDRLTAGEQLVIPTSGNVNPPAGSTDSGDTGGTDSGIVHTVQAGETLFSIALRYGTTVEALAAQNGIVDVNSLDIGQQISIP
jgi:LysM repeat protein